MRKDELVYPQFHKVDEIIIVNSGSLGLMLPRVGQNISLDYLRDRSSLGQYSILRHKHENEGVLVYLVKSVRDSHIFRIPIGLLNEVRAKFPILDREMAQTGRWLALFGKAPICDFWIDTKELAQMTMNARDILKRKSERDLMMDRIASMADKQNRRKSTMSLYDN